MSTSSTQSASSVNDIEKKISELLISQKKKRPSNGDESPDNFSQMQEVPEEIDEESDGCPSDEGSAEVHSIKNEAPAIETNTEKIEQEKDKAEKKSNVKRAPKKAGFPVGLTKSTLMDLVTQDIERKQESNQLFQQQQAEKKDVTAPLFPQVNKNMQDNLNLQNLMHGANLINIGNSNKIYFTFNLNHHYRRSFSRHDSASAGVNEQ